MQNTLIPFLSLNDYTTHVCACLETNTPLIVVGSPGLGKSSSTESIAKDRKADYYKFVPATANPSDIGGLKIPVIEKGILEYFYLTFTNVMLKAKKETIIHIEDLLLSPPMVSNAIMSLIEARCINNQPISKHVKFVLDTNDLSHKSGSGQINAALNNRGSIVSFPIDVKGWIVNFALPNNVAKEVILFLHANPDCFNADEIPRGYSPFNTPRSWTKLSEFVKLGAVSLPSVASLIGSEVGGRFVAFVASLAKFGNLIAKVKHDPQSAPMFNNAQDIIGAVFMLSNHFEKVNVANFIEYIDLYQNNEYKSLLIDLGVQTHPDSKESPEYVKHITA